MFITVDILQKREAPYELIDFVNKTYTNGVQATPLIQCQEITYEMLHWMYKWLDFSQEDIVEYWKRANVINCEGIDESDNIVDSTLVADSSFVSGSSCVYDSEQIEHSTNIRLSKYVTDSSHIEGSEFVDASTRVLRGKNITDSSEVVDSVYIVNSHGIFDSNNIIDGRTIWHSKDLTNCGFCSNCNGLTNSLFCFKQEGGEYLVFNKPIDKTRFDVINRQFRRYASVTADMIEGFDGAAKKILDYRKHTKNIPDAFWNWVKTLPGYDSDIIYALTFNSQFLN